MACLKCGKKTTDEQSFCPRCLEIMEAYPVNADVHIQLPNRSTATDNKKASRKRRSLSAEEQVSALRRRSRRLLALVFLLALLLGAAMFFLMKDWFAQAETPIGQNYSVGEIFG